MARLALSAVPHSAFTPSRGVASSRVIAPELRGVKLFEYTMAWSAIIIASIVQATLELPSGRLSPTYVRELPPTYALYKPRGVLSAASDSNPNRRTLTDVMLAAGVDRTI